MTEKALGDIAGVREEHYRRSVARHIFTKIGDARGSRHDAGVRWPFELLQNALDAGPRSGRAAVEISLARSGPRFIFEHDGGFFSPQELHALIQGGSSKEFDSTETTGRFGTGFLVTHVLATRTFVSGVLATSGGNEQFSLVLDRDGDQEQITRNMDACYEAIREARPLSDPSGEPSARFEYVTEDEQTLQLGVSMFRACLPYLFATCGTLSRVHLRSESESWTATQDRRTDFGDGFVLVRDVSCEVQGRTREFRTIRVAMTSTPDATAIVVLSKHKDAWRVVVPELDLPRVFRRYPIRSSAFLPINIVLDAPFDLDQERRQIKFDESTLGSRSTEQRELNAWTPSKFHFRAAIDAAVLLLTYAFQQKWEGWHWLARAEPSPKSFADNDDAQVSWLTSEMRTFAARLACLPLVETADGLLPALKQDDPYADFLDVESDGVPLDDLWNLAADATGLCPPIRPLAETWSTIARGWRELETQVDFIALASLAKSVCSFGDDGRADQLDELKLRCDPHDWVARFLNVVGIAWAGRGTKTDLLEGMLPNQLRMLLPLDRLRRDAGIPESLKDIADALGCNVRERLLDQGLLSIANEAKLVHVDAVLKAAVPGVLTEEDVIAECIAALEKRFAKAEQLEDTNRALILASIDLLGHLAQRGGVEAPLARRVPLLAQDDSFARVTAPMMAPPGTWDPRAQEFDDVYPASRILSSTYADATLVKALASWGLVFPDPLIVRTPSEPIKDERLKALVDQAADAADTNNVHLQSAALSDVALLHELIPRCQNPDVAVRLLGLILRYIAPADSRWRATLAVVGRREGAEVGLTIRPALWLADLRSRNWVPVQGEGGKTSQGIANAETLRAMLTANSAWLENNEPALELLGNYFGFDRLDLRLLNAGVDLRDQLARIVELAGVDPDQYATLVQGLEEHQRRARAVDRCRTFGLAVQAAIEHALTAHDLVVKEIDRGFDFTVADALEDPAVKLKFDSLLVEVKATTQGDAKLTPLQAETASREPDRYVLCVVDLRGVTIERLEQPWAADDVIPIARMVEGIGAHVKEAWDLVEEATSTDVQIRNEKALRYAVPPEVWETGCSISDWVKTAFGRAATPASMDDVQPVSEAATEEQ